MKSNWATSDLPPRATLWPDELHAMAFRLIPADSFRMGSRGYYGAEEPRHEVRITRSFWLGETPVTQVQYRFLARQCSSDLERLAGNKGVDPSYFKDCPDHPVELVSWDDAYAVANCLSGLLMEQVADWPTAPNLARLPTEAEWEYACRAGTESEYYTGDGEEALGEAGWYGGNSGSSTHPVGKEGGKQPNAWGLSDMLGNVWEWCLDGYDRDAYAKRGAMEKDPFVRAESDDSRRVNRGGSWRNHPGFCRSAVRDWYHPGNRRWDLGFRLCLSSGPVDGVPGYEAEPASGAGGSGADDQATRAGGAEGAAVFGELKPPSRAGE